MEIAQHRVAAPPAHEADSVCVDTGYKGGHGTSGPHRVSGNVFRCEPHFGAYDIGCGA